MPRRLHADAFFTPQRDFYCLANELPMLTLPICHCHEFYEVEIITAGTAMDTINGVSHILHRGDFLFLRPDDSHCIFSRDESGSSLVNLAISVPMMQEILTFLEIQDQQTLPWPITGHLPLELISQLSAQARQLTFPSKLPSQERSLFKQWITVCFLHADHMTNPQPEKNLPPWLQELLARLKTPEGLTGGIDFIKTHTDLSYPHICRCFRKYLQQTPVEWINENRLLHAAHLLLHTQMSILEISMECGFNTLSHFNHLFKAFFGISPSTLRTIF